MKEKFNFIHISIENFSLEKFLIEITKNFKLNTTYSILLKISSTNNLNFKMCGPQIGLVIGNEHDLDYYSKLYDLILIRIEAIVENYDYMENIESLEMMYSIIIPQKELALTNISSYTINHQLINKKEVEKNFNKNLLPLTPDQSYFGIKVYNEEEKNNLINLIKNNNFLSKIEKQFSINNSDNIFLYSPDKNKKFIVISKKIDDYEFSRYIFDFFTGIFINKLIDTLYIKDNNVFFDRRIGNITLTIENQKIKIYKVKNKIHSIVPYNKPVTDRNTNIGAFDLESFKDSENLAKVYALGFVTSIDREPQVYYLTDIQNLDSTNLILKCINDMLVNKYNNFIFFAHNLGHYDIFFIYNVLLNYNLNIGYEYYILNTTMRDNTIIKLEIKIKLNSKIDENKFRYIKISFLDSLNFFNCSLDKLTKEFNIDLKKGKFPHTFVHRNNLNYIGNKPDYYYYDNLALDQYNKIPSHN